MQDGGVFSVVIPAHNEEGVIGACLGSLLAQCPVGSVEVVVVCNGCTDETALVARSIRPDVVVVELTDAGKARALNAGDAMVTSFPRWYLDADVVLKEGTVSVVNDALRRDGIRVAAPRLLVDDSHSSWPVRAYHRVWLQLPYVSRDLVGSGVYVLNHEGRSAFNRFPDVMGDDAFVRSLFPSDERMSVEGTGFVARAPRTWWSLVRVRARTRASAHEVAQRGDSRIESDVPAHAAELGRRLRNPSQWVDLAVYGATRLAAEALFLVRYRLQKSDDWAQDTSSRDV